MAGWEGRGRREAHAGWRGHRGRHLGAARHAARRLCHRGRQRGRRLAVWHSGVSQTSWLSLRPGWLSKGSCQRRIMPQTARSFGQPRRISRRAALAGCIGLRFDLGTAVASLNKGEAGGRVRVMLADGSELAPRLVLACDGLDSRVRNTLRQWSGDGASFDPVVLPSASSGLNYKMLLVPPSFEMRNLSTAAPANALIRNEPQSERIGLSLRPAGVPGTAFSARPCPRLPLASASRGQPRTASVNQPPAPRWLATQALFSTQARSHSQPTSCRRRRRRGARRFGWACCPRGTPTCLARPTSSSPKTIASGR